MDFEPKPLNIQLPISSFTWRYQRFYILAGAFLSLYVIWPTSLALAVCVLVIGTPLFWLIFGSKIFYRITLGLPHFVRLVIFLVTVYVFSKILAVIINWIAMTFGIA